jgi:hypothetical protein
VSGVEATLRADHVVAVPTIAIQRDEADRAAHWRARAEHAEARLRDLDPE